MEKKDQTQAYVIHEDDNRNLKLEKNLILKKKSHQGNEQIRDLMQTGTVNLDNVN